MFYKCPKCQKVWQYPIGKCPECFSELEGIFPTSIKVIGISKVEVPTIFHPKIPYFVLVLEDEEGNRWVQKSVKEYKIGEKLQFEVSTDKNAVSIWRLKYDSLEGIEKVINLLGGLELDENSKVLILPALGAATHPYFRDNISPNFLGAILQFLLENYIKPENIKVGAQSFDEMAVEAKAQKSQLLDICLKNKVTPSDLAKGSFLKKIKGNLNFEISEEVYKSDLILNLPILKMGKSAATENILFLLRKENYLALKYLSSDKEIIENLITLLPQFLTIAEAEFTQDSEKFTHFLGLVLASFNSFNLDRVFFEILRQKELPEILKEIKIEDVPIVGRQIKEVSFKPKI